MRDHLGKKAASLGSAVGLVVAAMALPARAQSFQSQLLENPGFESPTDSTGANTDSTVAGWSLYGNAVRASFQNNTPGGEWMIWLQTFDSFGGVYQDVQPVTDGTTYNLSAYWYFEANEPTVPGLVTDMALLFLNASDQPVGPTDANGFSDATYIPASSVTTTGAWLQYTVSGVAPTGATAVEVSFDFVNGSNGNAQGAFVDDADLSGDGVAQNTAQWAVSGSGDWNSSGNWTTGSVPNSVDAVADLFSSITSSPETIYTNAAITAGTLHFNNANEYVIAGAPTLTLQTTTGNALVQVDQGIDELDLPVTIASNTTFDVAVGATLLVANPVTVKPGESLSQTGGGTVTYQSIISVGTGGSIAFANSTHASELSLASGANASVGGSGTVLEVDTLANGGTINLQNNELLINYGSSADPVASVRAELQSGYANG
ncbi:MAG TPA: hypothetical protein VHX86_16170, partial [Tepidisphaeraceae bacterium]|nr:hypothetical protein [Tepidisphaeraceae bacterium]